MNVEFAQQLCELNNRFYRTWADSFSDTRHNTWPGWGKCLQETGLRSTPQKPQTARTSRTAPAEADNTPFKLSAADTYEPAALDGLPGPAKPSPAAHPLNILDVACGNLRFEMFLARTISFRPLFVDAFDVCDELAQSGAEQPGVAALRYHHCDVMDELQKETLNGVLCDASPADLTVSFGFMHHIPLPEWRAAFIDDLLNATKPGGFVCLSLWRFLSNKGMAERANATTAQGIAELGLDKLQFNEGDRLLGWKNEPGAYRYCHSFSDAEIAALAESTFEKATLKARFQADGRTGNLNEYLVLQRV